MFGFRDNSIKDFFVYLLFYLFRVYLLNIYFVFLGIIFGIGVIVENKIEKVLFIWSYYFSGGSRLVCGKR